MDINRISTKGPSEISNKKGILKQLFPKAVMALKLELITYSIYFDLSLMLYSETRLRRSYFRDFPGIDQKLHRISTLVI